MNYENGKMKFSFSSFNRAVALVTAFVALTVAGPRRNYTGLPLHPERTLIKTETITQNWTCQGDLTKQTASVDSPQKYRNGERRKDSAEHYDGCRKLRILPILFSEDKIYYSRGKTTVEKQHLTVESLRV